MAINILDIIPNADYKTKLKSIELDNPNNPDYSLLQKRNLAAPSIGAQYIVFTSAEHGSGSSELAFNTALYLAQHKDRVLYLNTELNTSIFYEYQLSIKNKNLNILTDLNSFSQRIIRYKDLYYKHVKSKNYHSSFMKKVIKAFPHYLNYLSVTPEFQAELIQLDDLQIKAVLREAEAFLSSHYDYVIIDAEDDLHSIVTQLWLNFAQQVVISFTQNSMQINSTGNMLDVFQQKMPDLAVHTVLNMYSDHVVKQLSKKYIWNLIGQHIDVLIPMQWENFQNASLQGIPIIMYEQKSIIQRCIQQLIDQIYQA